MYDEMHQNIDCRLILNLQCIKCVVKIQICKNIFTFIFKIINSYIQSYYSFIFLIVTLNDTQ